MAVLYTFLLCSFIYICRCIINLIRNGFGGRRNKEVDADVDDEGKELEEEVALIILDDKKE